MFDDLGSWPDQDWPHGPRADRDAQHMIERLEITSPAVLDALWPLVLGHRLRAEEACPCGSNIRYGRCHRDDVESLSWVRGLDVRDQLPATIMERIALAV